MQSRLARLLDVKRTGRWIVAVGALALLFPVSKAAAQATVDTHMPLTAIGANPCTGEDFAGSGFMHVKVFESVYPNYHVSMEVNVESFQAITPTGVRYVVPEQLSSHTIADADFAPVNATDEEIAHAIRQGDDESFVAGDDLYLRVSAHFTYNGNGDLTASFENSTEECR